MSLSKRLLKHRRTITALSYVLAGYIRLVYLTSRTRRFVDPAAIAAGYHDGTNNAIYCLWHGRMMLATVLAPPKRQHNMLISHHRDGILISQVISHFGHRTVSGSSSRGARGAVREMLRLLEAGEHVGITPDGPRGPNQQIVGKGAIGLARRSGKAIVPITFSASRCIRLGSWDRFMLALPFSRIVFCIGAPITVGADDDDDELCNRLGQAMNALVDKADEAARG